MSETSNSRTTLKVGAKDYTIHSLQGLPADDEDYEFTSGTLSHRGKEIEFRVDVDVLTGKYSVTPSELLELKGRAAKLVTAPPGGVVDGGAVGPSGLGVTSLP